MMNINDDDECRNDCTQAICGDGLIRDGIEECDDGNEDNTDGCLSSCRLASAEMVMFKPTVMKSVMMGTIMSLMAA